MTYHKLNIRKNKNTKGKKTQSKRKTKSQRSIRKKSLRREKKIGGFIEPAHKVVQACVDNASKSFFNDGKIFEQGPPEKLFGDPQNERTKQFLHAVLDAN